MRKRLAIAVLMVASVVSFGYARQKANLSSMSLEDLLNIKVTSVSKTEQKLSETASAIYVITQEDISPGYAFAAIHMHLDPSSQDTTSVADAEGSTPVSSAHLRSHFTLYRGISWDTSAYFVGRIAQPPVPSYTRLDTGLTWQAGESLSFSIFGQNLLNKERLEYVDTTGSVASALMKRGAYAKMRWIF
jgi:TonB dependent receptor